MRRARAILIALSAAFALSACGPEGLAERYGAEEAFWDAERYRDAFSGRGIPTARQEIMKRYRRLLARYRFTPWEETRSAPCLASVNGLRGLSRLSLGHVALAGGDVEVAGAEFAALLAESTPGGPLTTEAHLGLAKVLEARGDFAAAAGEYGVVFAELEPERAIDHTSLASLLPLPLYVASRFEALGNPAAADSVLADAERRVDAFRAAAADSAVEEEATGGLARIRAARGDALGASRLLEEAAGGAEGSRREALLVAGARMALDAGELAPARRMLERVGDPSRPDSLPANACRALGELLLREGRREEGKRVLLDLFEAVAGPEEERARAGVLLGDLESSSGDWADAAESYRRVETRYPTSFARVDATVRCAQLLDARDVGPGDARARAAADLALLASGHPGSDRSIRAEDAAAHLLEETGDWNGLIALLDGIVAARPERERAADALLRAALVARDRLPEPAHERLRVCAERLLREFSGTLAALQARQLGLLDPPGGSR